MAPSLTAKTVAPPLWGRTEEGGRADLHEKRAAAHSLISSTRATPHPCPPPQEGAGALTLPVPLKYSLAMTTLVRPNCITL